MCTIDEVSLLVRALLHSTTVSSSEVQCSAPHIPDNTAHMAYTQQVLVPE